MLFDLVIFDCDGVLVDSEPVVNGIEAELFTHLGIPMTPEEARALFKGRTVGEIVTTVEEKISRRLSHEWVYDWGMATALGLVRGLRRTHVVLATNILYLAILTVSQLLSPLLGPGFAILLFVAAPIAGIYLLVFPPFVAIRESLSMPDSLRRGWRAARMPGRGNLAMATFYVIPATAILVVSVSGRWSFALLGVNPTWTAWLYILFVNFLHIAALAAFAFRWMSIEAEAPSAEASARPERRPRPTGARRR